MFQASYSLGMSYDNLDRLETISKSAFGSGSVSYDDMGNILSKRMGSEHINYVYNSNKQLTSVNGGHTARYQYDDRGNVRKNSRHVFSYNARNQMTSAGSNAYSYDTDNKRVKMRENGKTSYSYYGFNGKLLYRQEDGLFTDYVYLGNKLVAKVEETTKPLPTTTGTVIARNHYKPFGATLGNTPDDVGFTGHKFDVELGLNVYAGTIL
ncbi:hypothetical protein ACFO4O_15145 [Glaciecola siphonariae]|uniref:Teneurin-like YD-shell domain-containing protein n=1 Tax=Glaciecola siphonariae TaxID=521012 RepID=A0ABV9LZC8_9ALTE